MAAKKAFWDKKNPKKKSKKLTSSQKAAAKRRAKAAGRPYPNLVDNAAVLSWKGNRVMATGTAGSSFTSELNRLANSGTYPVLTSYLAATGAANDYASTTGKALIGALNLAADANRQPNDFKALGGICNELASTTNLSPTDALRSIDL
jgi:hypothetical protein